MASVFEHATVLGRQLFDPRGRCNRQGFLALALALLALQTVAGIILAVNGKPIDGPLAMTLNAPLVWIGAMAVLKRLHDMGRTGWWVLGGFVTWLIGAIGIAMIAAMVLGPDNIQQGSLGFWIVFAMITLPAFGALLYMHAAPGDETANKYGEVPGPLGFSPAPKREELVPATVAA